MSKLGSTRLHLMAVILVVGTCASAGGFYAAKAATPSTSTPLPLYYSGFLSQSGVAVNTSHNIQIRLLDKATGGSSLVPDCSFGPAMIPVSAGHFSVQMSSNCDMALQASRAAFVEVQVDGSVVGTGQQVGAAPFSYAAEQADQASAVAFTGVQGITTTTEWPGTVPFARVTAVPPTVVLEAFSDVAESEPTAGVPLVYSHALVNLTPGTWLVEASATVFATGNADEIGLSLFDVTTNVDIPGSLGGIASSSINQNVPLSTSKSITVSVPTLIEMKATANGGSVVNFGNLGGGAGLKTGQMRIFAIKVQ